MFHNKSALEVFEEVNSTYIGSGYNAMDAMKIADKLCYWGIDRSYDGSLSVYQLPPNHIMVLGSSCGLKLHKIEKER